MIKKTHTKFYGNFDINIFIYFSLISLKIIYSYYIPVNLNPGAPHDDTLFYRLGLSISNGLWLGVYDPTTLIKGITYPLFIATSIKLHIPLRVLEAALTSAASLYFITSISQYFNKKALLIGFILIIFYPYLLGPLDFRILRDMIYPQLMLIVFSSLFHLFKNSSITWRTGNYIHGLIFGISLFFFLNTREEGIWIFPALLFGLILCIIFYKKNNTLIKLLCTLLIAIIIFISLSYTHKALNYKFLNSPITNIFKDSDFQNGYGSILRANKSKLTYDTITSKDWESIFEVSPSALRLKNYITGPSYKGWLDTGCFALESIQRDMNRSSCYGPSPSIPVGHFMFALMDALTSSGSDSPQAISSHMKQIGIEIDQACEQGKLACAKKPLFMMPSGLFNEGIIDSRMMKIISIAFNRAINYENPDLENYELNNDLKNVFIMHKDLGGYIFRPNLNVQNDITSLEPKNLKSFRRAHGEVGYVDGVSSNYGKISIFGWAHSSKKQKFKQIYIQINDNPLCLVTPNISRPDINPVDPSNIGFNCLANFTPEKNQVYRLEAFAIDENSNTLYKLDKTEVVTATMSNQFNPQCYLNFNPDVKKAVAEGKITVEEHFQLYGALEKRKCIPIYYATDTREKYNEIITLHSLSTKSAIKYVYSNSNAFYHYMNLAFIAIIPLGIVLVLKKKKFQLASIMAIFLILFLSRVVLLAVLDYLGLAVISALYLVSGMYAYFLLGIIALLTLTFIHSLIFLPGVNKKK